MPAVITTVRDKIFWLLHCSYNMVGLVKEDAIIPQSIIRMDGAVAQLNGHKKSDLASEILNIAADFQSKASNNRLGQPRAQNPSLQKSRFNLKNPGPGIAKGKMILTEMKAAAKEDFHRIKITAGLYLLSRAKNGVEMMKKVLISPLLMRSFHNLMTFGQVSQVHFSLKFSENTPIFDALGGVLLDAQEFHQKSFPLAKPIQRWVHYFDNGHDDSELDANLYASGRIPAFMLLKVPQSITV